MTKPAAAVATAVFAAFVLAAPLAASLSAAAAALAVALPQLAAFSLVARAPLYRRRPLAFWGVKFSLTMLCLAVALRLLHEGGMLAAPYFIAGVVLAVAFNIVLAARFARAHAHAPNPHNQQGGR